MEMITRLSEESKKGNSNTIVLVICLMCLAEEWGQISNEAKELINKMLTYDPSDRISSHEALNDPWIQSKAPSQQVNTKQLKNLQNFYVEGLWVKLARATVNGRLRSSCSS